MQHNPHRASAQDREARKSDVDRRFDEGMAKAGGRHSVRHEAKLTRSEIEGKGGGGCCCFGGGSARAQEDMAEYNADALESQIGGMNLNKSASQSKHVKNMDRGDLISGAKGMKTGHACVLHSDVRVGNGERKSVIFSDAYTPQMQNMPLNEKQLKQIIGRLNAGMAQVELSRMCRKKVVGVLIFLFCILLTASFFMEMGEERDNPDAVMELFTAFSPAGYMLYGAAAALLFGLCLCGRMVCRPGTLHAKKLLKVTMKPFVNDFSRKKLDMALHIKADDEITLYMWTQGANIDINTDGLSGAQFGFLEF